MVGALETALASGSASLAVVLPLTQNPSGATPELSLTYDTGGGNGPFGVGWSLTRMSVRRSTRQRVPRYRVDSSEDIFELMGDELVPRRVLDANAWVLDREPRTIDGRPTEVTSFRPRIERAHALIERVKDLETGELHWRTRSRGNVLRVYGSTPGARVADPASPDRVFEWLLEEERHPNGSLIHYVYKSEDTAGIELPGRGDARGPAALSATNAYLKRVLYGNTVEGEPGAWRFELVLDYGEHLGETPGPEPDHAWPARRDAFSNRRAGFHIRTQRLCNRFLMFHHFPEQLGTTPCLVRSTVLEYAESPTLTKLSRVLQLGHVRVGPDETEYATRSLPPSEFFYSEARIDPWPRPLAMSNWVERPGLAGNKGAAWVDLDGEGIPSVLANARSEWHFSRRFAPAVPGASTGDPPPLPPHGPPGSLAPAVTLRQRPSTLPGGYQLIDLSRDGSLDVVEQSEPAPGFHERVRDEGWTARQHFKASPRFDRSREVTRFADLTGDGLPDMVLFRRDGVFWHRSDGEAGYAQAGRVTFDGRALPGVALDFRSSRRSITFQDVTGDGLPDLVVVTANQVAYWPNLGHGRFGAPLDAQLSTPFAPNSRFDKARLRFADIDGSGTTDIVYLGESDIEIHLNEAGNAFAPAIKLEGLPRVDRASEVEVRDFAGQGTASVIWTSSRPGDQGNPVRVVDLMADGKPHLLTRFTNGIGAETRITYRPSTWFALEDKAEGRPWLHAPPFPLHVVERSEQRDWVANTQYVSIYRYHDGCYDPFRREFAGFRFVEQWAADNFESGAEGGSFGVAPSDADERYHTAPTHTRIWIHAGISGPNSDGLSYPEVCYRMPDAPSGSWPESLSPVLPAGLSPVERREALLALRGATIRTEIFGRDGSQDAHHPYEIALGSSSIRMLQPRLAGHAAVFEAIPEQSLRLALDRRPEDPRITQKLTLSVDPFGNVTDSATIFYPRSTPAIHQQAEPQCLLQHADVLNHVVGADIRWLGVTFQTRSYEVRGVDWEWDQAPVLVDAVGLKTLADDPADHLPFETPAADAPAMMLSKRLLSWSRTYFRTDASAADLDELSTGLERLALGQIDTRGLPYETYTAVMSDDLASDALGDLFDSSILADLGYHREADVAGMLWAPSGRLAFGEFLRPIAARDAFGAVSTVRYDAAGLPDEAIDPVGLSTTAENDFRIMGPSLVRDPNGDETHIRHDALGLPAGIARVGANGEGDTLEAFEPNPPLTPIGDEGLANAVDLLAGATSRTIHDVGRYHRTRSVDAAGRETGDPIVIATLTRETHRSDETGAPSVVLQAFAYVDGLGREVAVKVEAAADPQRPGAPNWICTGRVVRDNKGAPVRQFEPFFSPTARYAEDEAFAETGVASLITYDPAGRTRRIDHPDATFEQTDFDPWSQTTHDRIDTVLESAWYLARGSPDPNGPEPVAATPRAAYLSARRAETPTRVHLDTLGRTVVADADLGDGNQVRTRTVLDISGNQLAVIDDRGNAVESARYDMAGRALRSMGMDRGERRAFYDAAGRLRHGRDARGHRHRFTFDDAQRPLATFLTGPDGIEHLVALAVYGEQHAEAAARRLLGRAFRSYDASGASTIERYDFKGNPLATSRRLSRGYRETQLWDGLDPASGLDAIAQAAEVDLETEVHTSSVRYDALDRVVEETSPDGSIARPRYDASGLLALEVELRGEAPRSFVETIVRNPRGQRLSIRYGNGVTTSYAYDPLTFRLEQLLTERALPSATLQDLRYVYDAAGHIVEIVDRAQPTVFANNQQIEPRRRFAYDALGRLISAEGREHPAQQLSMVGPDPPPAQGLPHPNDPSAIQRYGEAYEYDTVGNIRRMTHSGAAGSWERVYDYAGDSNRLRATSRPGDAEGVFSDDAYEHDTHGNMTEMPHLSLMRWNDADRLQATARTVVMNGGTPETTYYVYDSSGARIRKVTERASGPGQTPTRRAERRYLARAEIYREFASDGETVTLERQTLHVMDDAERIALVETRTVGTSSEPARGIRFQLGDHLGSAVLEVDETSALIGYEEYHPYGTTALRAGRSAAEVSLKRYRYTGMESDAESGLQLHGVRYYATWLGLWIAADPIGTLGGLNAYRYAASNPLSLQDKSGTLPFNPLSGIRAQVADEMKMGPEPPPAETAKADPQRMFDNVTKDDVEAALDDPDLQNDLEDIGVYLNGAPDPYEGAHSKSAANAVALAPFEPVFLILSATHEGAAAEVEAMREQLRPFPLAEESEETQRLMRGSEIIWGLAVPDPFEVAVASKALRAGRGANRISIASEALSDGIPGGVGSARATSGTADIRYYRLGEDPHFSIDVRYGSEAMETEQVIVNKYTLETTIKEAGNLPAPLKEMNVSIPNAPGAVEFQKAVVGTNTGTYNLLSNSCATHVCDVLRAGGVDAPEGGIDVLRFLKGLQGK
ncbi:MAG: SpvB/TcaC N-terminal domain-containing protein [Pseudomonadota bacterium]